MSSHDEICKSDPESRKHVPRNGAARALLDADPETPVEEIPKLLADVERWECQGCEKQLFIRPMQCGDCGGERFEKVVPNGGGAASD